MFSKNRMFNVNQRLKTNYYLEIIAKCAVYFVGVVATAIGIGLYLAGAWVGFGAFIVTTLLVAASRSKQYTVNHEEPRVIGSADSSSTDPKDCLREENGRPPLAPRLTSSSSSSSEG